MAWIAFVFAAGVALLIASEAAHADDKRDCAEAPDPRRKVESCSRLLAESGQPREWRSMTLWLRATGYQRMRDFKRALADYDESISLNPGYVDSYINRAGIYGNLRQYPKALADLNEAIKLGAKEPIVFLNRGRVHEALKQYDKALADYDEALKHETTRGDPREQRAEAYMQRAGVYGHFEKWQEAERDYGHAISYDPSNISALVGRAWAYKFMRKPEQAKEDLKRALELQPRNNRDAGHLEQAREMLRGLEGGR